MLYNFNLSPFAYNAYVLQEDNDKNFRALTERKVHRIEIMINVNEGTKKIGGAFGKGVRKNYFGPSLPTYDFV